MAFDSTFQCQEAQSGWHFNEVHGSNGPSSIACQPTDAATDALSGIPAFISSDDITRTRCGPSQSQTFLDQLLHQWQMNALDLPCLEQHCEPCINRSGSGQIQGVQHGTASPPCSGLCYTPPPFQLGSNNSSSSALQHDCHMVAATCHEDQRPQFHPSLHSRNLASSLNTPSNCPQGDIALPSTGVAVDTNEWAPNMLDGVVGTCEQPSTEGCQPNRMSPEAFPEVRGSGDADMLDASLSELLDFSSEALSGLDGMDDSFSSQLPRHPCVPSSTDDPAGPAEQVSPGFASHLAEGPLPSIFDDVDLRGLGSHDYAAINQDKDMHTLSHPGQATSTVRLHNLDSTSLREPWSRAHPIGLDTGHASVAAGLTHARDNMRPSNGVTWDGSMPPVSAGIALISRAKAVTAANAGRCQAADAVDRQQPPLISRAKAVTAADADQAPDAVYRRQQPNEAPSKPLVVPKESQLVQLLHTLAQPVTDSSDRLVCLGEINQLRGATPRTSRYKALYHKNLRDLSPNRPWLDLCPWLAQMPRSMVSVEAWREGRLPDGACGTVVTPSAPLFKPTPLGDLAGVPISAWQNFVGHLLAHMVNAQAFSSRRGDALEHQSLQLLASITTMWFYVAALSPDHSDAGHAMEGHGFDAAGRYKEDAPTPASCRAEVLLDTLKLTRQQQKLAKGIWKEWHQGLAQAKEDRQHILSKMQASGAAASMQRGMQPDMYSETSALLEQAAALAENCVIQQEITLHCHHRFFLQVCKPESIARVYAAAWPCWLNKTDLLRAVVEAS